MSAGQQALPPGAVRARIAAAVRQAVAGFEADLWPGKPAVLTGTGNCALAALAGARLANSVTGRTVYRVAAGALEFRLSDTPGPCAVARLDPAGNADGHPETRFHSWILAGRGTEVVDLSLYTYPAIAWLTRPWDGPDDQDFSRKDWPAFYWGRLRGLRDLGVTLRPDRPTLAMILSDPATRQAGQAVAVTAADYYHDRTRIRRPWRSA